jgi:hypothetical protein
MKTVIVAYYIYAALCVGLFSWGIFEKGASAWWSVVLLLVVSVTPKVKVKDKKNDKNN